MGKVKRNISASAKPMPGPEPAFDFISSVFGQGELSPHNGRHKHIGFKQITLKAGMIEAHYVVTGYSGLTMEGVMTVHHSTEDGFGKASALLEEEMRKLYRKAER